MDLKLYIYIVQKNISGLKKYFLYKKKYLWTKIYLLCIKYLFLKVLFIVYKYIYVLIMNLLSIKNSFIL